MLRSKCLEKGESALVKAARLKNVEIVYSILQLLNKDNFDEVLHATDSVYTRNVLHWAVINKDRNLIDLLVRKMDADRAQLRGAEDNKKRRPIEYDQSSQFTELFNTGWTIRRRAI